MRRVWGVVVLCAVGCGASNAGTSANADGPLANGACPPPTEIARLLGEGRIGRATQAFKRVPERCRHALGDAWGDAALALAELGESASATAEAARIDAEPRATAGARRGALGAREQVARTSAKTNADDKQAMLEAYDRALDAEHEGRSDVAISGYLEAWSRFRPNPQALIRVGRVHGRAGHEALAQRFYDRGVAELARVTGKAPAAVGFSFDPDRESTSIRWVPGERAVAVHLGEQRRILDSNTFEVLATYGNASGFGVAFAPNGRFMAAWSPSDDKTVEVFHVRSGHRVLALELKSSPRSALFDPKSSRLAVVEDSGSVGVFALSSGQRQAHFEGKRSLTQLELAFLDDRRLYAAFDAGRRQFVWNVDENKELWNRDNPDEWMNAQRSGEKLVYLSVKKQKPTPSARATAKANATPRAELTTQNLATGKSAKPFPLPADASDFALASPDVAVVALAGGKAVAHRLDTGKMFARIQLPNWDRVYVSSGANGSVVLVDGELRHKSRTWTPATNQDSELQEQEAMQDGAFGPALARAESGRTVYLEDLDTLVVSEPNGTKRTSRRARSAELGGVALSPSGEGIVVGDGRGIRSVSLRSARMGWLGERGLPNADLDFSADGKTLLAAGPRLVVLDGKSGALRDQLAFPDARDAHISADGTEVVAVDPTRGVIWNVRAKAHRFEDRDGEPGTSSAATAMCCQEWVIGPDQSPFKLAGNVATRGPHIRTPDGNRIAIVFQLEDEEGSENEDISKFHGVDLFDARSQALIARVNTSYETFVAELAIDYSGRFFTTVSGVGGGAALYQVEKKQRIYLGDLYNLTFRRDSRLLAGVSPEGVALHRTADGRLLGSFLVSRTDPDSAAFISHDGTVEWIGKPGGLELGCRAGTMEVPFEACADRLVKPGLIQETFAAYAR